MDYCKDCEVNNLNEDLDPIICIKCYKIYQLNNILTKAITT